MTGVDETTWKSWCKEVRQGFVQRNLPALPIELIPRNNGNFLDNRCFVDHFNALTSAYYSLHSQHLVQAREMTDLRRDFATLSCRNERMEQQLIESNKLLGRIGNRIEVMTPTKKELSDKPTEGYKHELASSNWTRMLKSEQTRIKNHHKKLKKFIKTMLFFCPEYPNPRPESVKELVQWKRDIAHTARVAEIALYQCLDPDSKRRKFAFDFTSSHPLVKRFENKDDPLNKELPSNTPSSVQMYFGATID
ncbi:unknown protein [Seminavis robusta]|uniref:Uncharacterized protein n=1 Tax=Seminavis robusta TaxID=568900 RepID=A0A9N8DKJ6_9STRA|nr:unknown protein [Seminavis robusta]|eukprot:Sro109_g054390.1 n/a (250) ;mRNA; r:2821-3669